MPTRGFRLTVLVAVDVCAIADRNVPRANIMNFTCDGFESTRRPRVVPAAPHSAEHRDRRTHGSHYARAPVA
ncbi:hypothetical protein BD413DRAFT_519617 [Trametes elegans]|nr:hypothetical protein BD413DRAFT_519617 [Trametes elegans]